MNWEEVGAIGQILGSLAVFVTIGFLAIQVRHSETESQRAMERIRRERGQQFLTLATDERLAAIHVKANKALGGMTAPYFVAASKELGLTEVEAYSLFLKQLARWNLHAYSILDVDELRPRDRAQLDRGLDSTWSEPAFRFWYQHLKTTLHANAVRYVDNLLAHSSTP